MSEGFFLKSKYRIWHELLFDSVQNGEGIHLIPRASKIYRFAQFLTLFMVILTGIVILLACTFFGLTINRDLVYLYGTLIGANTLGTSYYETAYNKQKRNGLQGLGLTNNLPQQPTPSTDTASR